MRELAIGDIHGCARSFETLLELVQPAPTDTIILLGDFIDRGPDSCRVMDMILDLNQRCTVVAVTGNHEIMLRQAATDREVKADWWRHGGQETMRSYVKEGYAAEISAIPDRHWQFLVEQTLDYWETDERIYVHASVDPKLDLDEQPESLLFWQPFTDPMVHKSGKQIICGHTAQKSGMPAVFERGICIDTYAHGGGWLTCLDAAKQTVLQTNERGEHRILPSLDHRPKGRR